MATTNVVKLYILALDRQVLKTNKSLYLHLAHAFSPSNRYFLLGMVCLPTKPMVISDFD